MVYSQVNVTVPHELLEKFDRARGLIPRSTALQALMAKVVAGEVQL